MKPTKNLLLALFLPVLMLANELESNARPGYAVKPIEIPDSSASLPRSLAPSLSLPIAPSLPRSLAPLPQVEHHGIVNITEIGYGFGLGDAEPDFAGHVVSLTTVFDWEINKQFIAGLGTGVNFYNGGTMIPLFIDARYYFNDLKTTPFIVLDFGEMFSLENISHSGLFANPMVGVRRVVNEKNLTLNLSLGGLVQKAPDGVRNSFVNFRFGITWRVK